MPDISQVPNGPIHAAEDDAPPTWDEMRQSGCVLIDDEHQKLAVYAGEGGCVVLMSQELDDPSPRYAALDVDFIPKLATALEAVRMEAAQIAAELEAKYEAAEAQMQRGEA